MKKTFFISLFLILVPGTFLSIFAQDLSILPEDLALEDDPSGGYHLFIRKKAGINSVLLTESTKDPEGIYDTYAYRSPSWNPVNGDEVRVLNGQPIPKEMHIYSLIDSSPEPYPAFGEGAQAFHIYLPYIIAYGSADTRHADVYVGEGTYINIRAFNLPYASYNGSFKDNPYTLHIIQEENVLPPEPLPSANYPSDTDTAFRRLGGEGQVLYSPGPDYLVGQIMEILRPLPRNKTCDVVICLDVTASMAKYIAKVKSSLSEALAQVQGQFPAFRIGLLQYKDYYDDFLTQAFPFYSNMALFNTDIAGIKTGGGMDIPEAVHEAIYAAANDYSWIAESREIIVIGDAPPHPVPKGKITEEIALKAARERGITVNTIVLPR
ncbi:MAG: VWA domain-containing protein [Spirochaetaceae bacterium]|jgi:hypothetical protein|nr:VWA domain-containing protein [Spirochaetaceae bacterium]